MGALEKAAWAVLIAGCFLLHTIQPAYADSCDPKKYVEDEKATFPFTVVVTANPATNTVTIWVQGPAITGWTGVVRGGTGPPAHFNSNGAGFGSVTIPVSPGTTRIWIDLTDLATGTTYRKPVDRTQIP